MLKRFAFGRTMFLATGLVSICLSVPACTEEEAAAVLAGVQVVANELDDSEDVSFRDWLSSELDD